MNEIRVLFRGCRQQFCHILSFCAFLNSPVRLLLILPLCFDIFKGKPDLNTSLPVRQTASIFKQPVTKVTNHPNNKVKTDPQKAVDQPRQVNTLRLLLLTSPHTNLKCTLSDTYFFGTGWTRSKFQYVDGGFVCFFLLCWKQYHIFLNCWVFFCRNCLRLIFFFVCSYFGRRNSVVSMLMTLQRSWWKQWNCLKACKVIYTS